MSGLHRSADGRPDRPFTALRLLAAAGEKGLTTPEIVNASGEEDKGARLSWYGGVLRQALAQGWVRELGRESGGWQKGKAIRWAITDAGVIRLKEYADARAGSPTSERRRQAAVRAAARKAAQDALRPTLDQAVNVLPSLTQPSEKYELAVTLRNAGCTLQQIADVFGCSREWIRQVLEQGTWQARPKGRE